jgi:hypothetical protein
MMQSDAILSKCGIYRYQLERVWEIGYDRVVWIMLNPSTADATEDDPTIRRCIRFSKDWGYAGLVVVNLFALRATNPQELQIAADPIGPQNDQSIFYASTNTGPVIAAWGAHKMAEQRAKNVLNSLASSVEVKCLGVTKSGAPRHPLYVKADTILEDYR